MYQIHKKIASNSLNQSIERLLAMLYNKTIEKEQRTDKIQEVHTMKNEKTYTITLTHLELLDIRLALVHAKYDSNNGGEKFKTIREKIVNQMKAQED